MSSSLRAKKASALQALRNRRSGLTAGPRTEEYEAHEEDVYENVAEEDYQELVRRRREREDFVVDDDGLGYHDDGEENFHSDTEDPTSRKRSKPTTAALTAAALKKARRDRSALRSLVSPSTDADPNAPAEGGNRSMWDFVRPGHGAAAIPSRESVRVGEAGGDNFESLLEGLDEFDLEGPIETAQKRGKVGGRGRKRSSGKPRRMYGTVKRHNVREHRFRTPSDNTIRNTNDEQYQDVHNDNTNDDVDTDDDTGIPFHEDDEDATMQDTDQNPTTQPPAPTTSTPSQSPPDQDNNLTHAFKTETDTPPTITPAPRRKRLLVKSTRDRRTSAPARAVQDRKQAAAVHDASTTSSTTTTAPKFVDTTSSSFQPDVIKAEGDSMSGAAVPRAGSLGNANLEAVLQHEVIQAVPDDTDADTKETTPTPGRNYVDLFWIDASEKNGVIQLFGKVKTLTSPPSAPEYVSCCATIQNNQRNLFVLPKTKSEGGYESIMDVHTEMKSILQPRVIPKVAGASWGGKPVKRSYAFGDASVPREETEYLKIVYDAKFPALEHEQCFHPNREHIAAIFGGGASVLETFILKRKLMGPCWIRMYNVQPCGNGPTSWCKMELEVRDPKNVKRCDLLPEAERPGVMAAPPMVTVSLKLKTVVNPKTHKAEVVSVSAICHKNVLLEGASDESTTHMTQLSLIRPLGGGAGRNQFPRDMDGEVGKSMPQLLKMVNERSLLNRLFTQLGIWDPDVICGHNAIGYDMEVLLTRCAENKDKSWSKLGRRRRTYAPKPAQFQGGKDWAISDAMKGRLLCDTYVSSKELLRETTYSLTNLAKSQLKTERVEIEPVDIPQWYNSSQTIVQLAMHTLNDAQLVQRLMFKLQVLPLTKQLTCIAGNLWSRTMKGNRAERNEFLLLHEFHQLKYIVPEKETAKQRGVSAAGRTKSYSGGLVLEPKKGLYDSFILLLDFNSLYPSIIQEYNLCFTTVDHAKHSNAQIDETKIKSETEGGQKTSAVVESLPPLPTDASDKGVLPRVIKTLVDRRRTVKQMLKQEKDPDKREELDIRQMALKLTANSMYGCLGFSHSRFYAQPIAALITAMGRETLQRTVAIAEDTVGLDVIYGDTDSIMINTRIPGHDLDQLSQVHELGQKVKREVNKLYRTVELEIDGVFRTMLLLKKKKYAAVTVTMNGGKPVLGKEMKGLDLVRRDWCIQSKDTGRYVLDQILSAEENEVVVAKIHKHLEQLAATMRKDELPLEKYVITKGLSKHPNDYPDGKSQPHVQVARMMLKVNRPVNTGDHIPYIITRPQESGNGEQTNDKKLSPAERARHPEEIQRSGGKLKPDVEWYLTQQLLPTISRLCEPIHGTSQSIIAEKLGLDSTKYNQNGPSSAGNYNDEVDEEFTPTSRLPDAERFKNVEKFSLTCKSCQVSNEIPGAFVIASKNNNDDGNITSGYRCTNPECTQPDHWGYETHFDLLSLISNKVDVTIRRYVAKHGTRESVCEDSSCFLKSRQQSVKGDLCLARGCQGSMKAVYQARNLDTQVKYLRSLFDMDHCYRQYEQSCTGTEATLTMKEVQAMISVQDRALADALRKKISVTLNRSGYNVVSPKIFNIFFPQ